ncbi:hypothetical protein Tco_0156854 [Tanacetum coccineum]
MAIDYAAGGRLRKLRPEVAWETIEDLARYEEEGWNDPIFTKERSLNYKNANIEQLLGAMECKVDTLMKDAISLMVKSGECGLTSNKMRQLPLEPSHQKEFECLVMNFIFDQEENVHQLEEYMCVIGSDFMQLSSEVVEKLKEDIRVKKNKFTKIKKITRYPDTEDLEPLNGHEFSKADTEKASFHAPKFVSPNLVQTITETSSLDMMRKKPNPQSSPQVLPSFEESTPPVTYPDEVEEIIGIPIEVKPLDETPLEDLGLNTCNHDILLSSKEIPSVDEPEPQLLPNFSPLEVNLGDKRGINPPIKPHSPNSFRMKEVDSLTIPTPPSPHVASFYPKDVYCYYHPCLNDPKKHYGFKPDLLGSITKSLSNSEVIFDEKKLGSS